jgi:hypothetical protein
MECGPFPRVKRTSCHPCCLSSEEYPICQIGSMYVDLYHYFTSFLCLTCLGFLRLLDQFANDFPYLLNKLG